MPYFLEGVPAFVAYFALGSLLLSVFTFVYVKLTAHDEVALVRAGNISAAITLGATMLGLALPLASAITNTQAILAAGFWSLVGCVVQIGAYGVARVVIPDLSARIDRDDRAAATMAAAISLAAAMLNAACMTY